MNSIFTRVINKYDLRHEYKDQLQSLRNDLKKVRTEGHREALLNKAVLLENAVLDLSVPSAAEDERQMLIDEINNLKVSLLRDEFKALKKACESKQVRSDNKSYLEAFRDLEKKIKSNDFSNGSNKSFGALQDEIKQLVEKEMQPGGLMERNFKDVLVANKPAFQDMGAYDQKDAMKDYMDALCKLEEDYSFGLGSDLAIDILHDHFIETVNSLEFQVTSDIFENAIPNQPPGSQYNWKLSAVLKNNPLSKKQSFI